VVEIFSMLAATVVKMWLCKAEVIGNRNSNLAFV
jgi:hypothetical protein